MGRVTILLTAIVCLMGCSAEPKSTPQVQAVNHQSGPPSPDPTKAAEARQYYLQGEKALRAGNLEMAAVYFEQALICKPDSAATRDILERVRKRLEAPPKAAKDAAKGRSSGSVQIDMGARYAENNKQCSVGEPEAVRCLASAVHTHPSTARFVLKWSAVYPSGGTYPHTIIYEPAIQRLVHDLGGTREVYSQVTPDILRALAADSETNFVTTEDLPERGCPMSYE